MEHGAFTRVVHQDTQVQVNLNIFIEINEYISINDLF